MFFEETFASAQENMDFDERLYDRLSSDLERFFRVYRWQNAGITYSYNKVVPEVLEGVNAGARMTGGGIVFHCPGDMVFSCGGRLDDDFFPGKLKEKMGAVSELFRSVFGELGVELSHREMVLDRSSIQFCNGYFNPYELYFGDQKVCAIAMRRIKGFYVMQGVVHLVSSFDCFGDFVGDYGSFFTRGIGGEKELYGGVCSALKSQFIS